MNDVKVKSLVILIVVIELYLKTFSYINSESGTNEGS